MQNSEDRNELVVSYLTQRKLIGFLGIGLPISILFHTFVLSSCGELESSISAYYHTVMRDILVGILCATGVFMITYKGYDRRDMIASSIAGIFAIGIAVFPTDELVICGEQIEIPLWISNLELHYIAASGLFATFAYMSLFLFTLSKSQMTRQKKRRNAVYRICGYVMLACLVAMPALSLIESKAIPNYKPVFWLETISLFAFGISWIVKGEAILKDS